jgi:hypothetical protein
VRSASPASLTLPACLPACRNAAETNAHQMLDLVDKPMPHCLAWLVQAPHAVCHRAQTVNAMQCKLDESD